MYGIENKSTNSNIKTNSCHLLFPPNDKPKKPEPKLFGKTPIQHPLILATKMSVIWLIHGLRRTRRDSNGGFIIESVNVGVSGSRYTTQPVTVE
jgi:hypothetical protein